MVKIVPGGQVGWAGILYDLARTTGNEIGVELIPLDTTVTDNPNLGPHWMFNADAVNGFGIYYYDRGRLEKEEFEVDQSIVDKEIVRGQIINTVTTIKTRVGI